MIRMQQICPWDWRPWEKCGNNYTGAQQVPTLKLSLKPGGNQRKCQQWRGRGRGFTALINHRKITCNRCHSKSSSDSEWQIPWHIFCFSLPQDKLHMFLCPAAFSSLKGAQHFCTDSSRARGTSAGNNQKVTQAKTIFRSNSKEKRK